MSNWLGTNGGRQIDLLNPDPDQIHIEDIAIGLANVCRFGGQLHTWYSVAEHCIHVADLLPPEEQLAGLLHDAAEAYICDIPTPLKRELGFVYTDIENRVAAAIGTKFGVELVTLSPAVMQADRMMVVSERDAFQTKPQDWGPAYETSLRYPRLCRRFGLPMDAQEAYLKRFDHLMRLRARSAA